MRTFFILFLVISFSAVTAQSYLPGTFMNETHRYSIPGTFKQTDSAAAKKWTVHTYSGIASSFSFFKGGNTTILAAPVGIQVTRRLTNNWYGFADLSVAPAYINFNHSFLNSSMNKLGQNNSFFNSNRLDIYSRAAMGVMYVNDQKTFSISGSIGIERSSYPLVPYPVNATGSSHFINSIQR